MKAAKKRTLAPLIVIIKVATIRISCAPHFKDFIFNVHNIFLLPQSQKLFYIICLRPSPRLSPRHLFT